MSLAPWRSPLSRALHRNRSLPYARYLQLATVREDGRPANRTVVFRGFVDDTNQLKFVTDSRSDKATELKYRTDCEACWYFPNTREQFRIAGSLVLIAQDCIDSSLQTARQQAWQELSDAARLQFAWPHPGKPRAEAAAFNPEPPSSTDPLPPFCLVLLDPQQVDHLELRGEPQNRCLYQLNGDQTWSSQAINP